MAKRISILGAGWVGLPLAKYLQQQGHTIKVSTTQAEKAHELRQQGQTVYQLGLTPQAEGTAWDEFMQSDVLVMCIPPRLRQEGPEFHPAQVQAVLEKVPANMHVLYTGSTGVFEDHAGEQVTEHTKPRRVGPRSRALGQAETLWQAALGDRFTLLRLGGLMGYDRIPGRMSQNKPVRNPADRVNFVHRDDAVGVLAQIIAREAWGHTLHAVAPVAATRKEVYEAAAVQGGWDVPQFASETDTEGHVVLSEFTAEFLDYTYHQPDPRAFSYTFQSK